MATFTQNELKGFFIAFVAICLLCAVIGAELMYVYMKSQCTC